MPVSMRIRVVEELPGLLGDLQPVDAVHRVGAGAPVLAGQPAEVHAEVAEVHGG